MSRTALLPGIWDEMPFKKMETDKHTDVDILDYILSLLSLYLSTFVSTSHHFRPMNSQVLFLHSLYFLCFLFENVGSKVNYTYNYVHETSTPAYLSSIYLHHLIF